MSLRHCLALLSSLSMLGTGCTGERNAPNASPGAVSGADATGGDETGAAFLELCLRAEAVPDADVTACNDFRLGETSSSAAARQALERQTSLLADARAGMQTTGDMGIAYEEGAMVLLPHLSPARRLAKLLHADAVLQAQDGHDAIAAADVAAIARIGRQVAADRIMISSLVAMSIARTAAAAGNSGGTSAEARESLNAAAAWLASDEPFGAAFPAFATERDYNLDYLAGEIRAGRLHQFAQIESIDRTAEATLRRAAGDLDAQIARCKDAYSELIQLLSTGGADTPEFQAFIVDVENGLHGDVATVMIGRAERFIELMMRTKTSSEITTFIDRASGG